MRPTVRSWRGRPARRARGLGTADSGVGPGRRTHHDAPAGHDGAPHHGATDDPGAHHHRGADADRASGHTSSGATARAADLRASRLDDQHVIVHQYLVVDLIEHVVDIDDHLDQHHLHHDRSRGRRRG